MTAHMRTSIAGLDVIKTFEGFRPRFQRLPDGRWIVGYGHVRARREGVQISRSEAETLLREYDLPPVEKLVSDCVLSPLNQFEFDALVSFAFNIGLKRFLKSDVVTQLNAGRKLAAADAFDLWRQAKIGDKVQTVDALVRRRAAEKALFLKPPGAMAVATSGIVRPLLEETGQPPALKLTDHTGSNEGRPVGPIVDVEKAESGPMEGSPDILRDASESVRKKMIRILGEDLVQTSSPSVEQQAEDGPTAEEITAAISELADAGSVGPGPSKSVWPPRDDLPQPPGTEAKRPDKDDTPDMPPSEAVIDDLETMEPNPQQIQHALEMQRQIEEEDADLEVRRAVPYFVFALIGLIMIAAGITLYAMGLARQSVWLSYIAPAGIIMGTAIFVAGLGLGARLLFSARA